MKYVLFVLLLFSGCNGCYTGPCYDNHYANVTAYAVNPNLSTGSGIAVDNRYVGSLANTFNLLEVDRQINVTEACLQKLYPDGRLPTDIIANAHCIWSTFNVHINRDCLKILIAPDTHMGCESEQVFSCTVNPELCVVKGLNPTPECPCECRGAIQDGDVIVVTPDLRMLQEGVIRAVTGCNFIWNTELATCYGI